jgi:uncharacterized protein YggE
MSKEIKVIGLLIVITAALFLLPWKQISWGKIISAQREIVTVTGEAKTQQKNEMASFTAGVTVIKENKDEAVNEVNKKTKDLIDSVKDFGIPDKDIKTQNMSVYQTQDPYRSDISNKWSVNNSIEITLRDVTKVNDLSNLLNKSGATNIYGPNFRMDDTNNIEKTLYDSAISDAKDKASIIATASGRKLGKVVQVSEGAGGTSLYPMYAKDGIGGGGGAVSEPGSATVMKSLVVTFELQ